MRFYIIFILLFGSFAIVAQGFRSRQYIPNALTNNAKAIFETSTGSYIAAGLIVDTINGQQTNRLVVTGLNANGQILWYKKYGNSKWIYLDQTFTIRSFYKHGNFIYHAGCVQDSNGKFNGVLLKFDLNGDTIWQKIYRDSLVLAPQMVTRSIDGGFLITGYFAVNNACLLIKTDANGNELWRKKIGVPNVTDGKAIVQDSSSKRIVIVGSQLANSSVHDNVFILDSLGALLNQYNYTGNHGGILCDLIQTSDKNFVAVGQKIYPETVGGINLIKSFAVKFDINKLNQPIWKIDGYGPLSITNNFNCVYELNNGDLIMGGDLDTLHLKNLPMHHYAQITKIDSAGKIKWNRIYDYAPEADNSYIQSMKALNSTSNGAILGAFQVYTNSSNPFFFVKYDSTGCDSSIAYCSLLNLVGLKEQTVQSEDFRLYPNPAKDIVNFRINTEKVITVKLTDVTGRSIDEFEIESEVQSLNVSNYLSGIYLVCFMCEGQIIQRKILSITK